ncbi:MAG: GNAT family N-acetyltransferase [Pseudomonadota bacterium]
MTTYSIAPDDLTSRDVRDLLTHHLREAREWSPACKVHALPLERLQEPEVAFFVARDGEALAAIGALKALDAQRGELKSMRAAPDYRGKGAGKAILLHLIQEARARGMAWLGLETGNTEPFAPARQLYCKHGFAVCDAFGDYVSDDFSLCMEKHL